MLQTALVKNFRREGGFLYSISPGGLFQERSSPLFKAIFRKRQNILNLSKTLLNNVHLNFRINYHEYVKFNFKSCFWGLMSDQLNGCMQAKLNFRLAKPRYKFFLPDSVPSMLVSVFCNFLMQFLLDLPYYLNRTLIITQAY